MKRVIVTLALTMFCSIILSAQNLIALEHNGVSLFYTSLDSAIKFAKTGDNIYVPGGSFSLNTPINKGINIIGVGYNQDSTLATGITQITSPVYIVSGADNGSITGVYFYNTSVQFGTITTNQKVTGFSISRCRISYNLVLGNLTTTSTNLVFTENVFDGVIYGISITNCFFSKNFIQSINNFGQGNEFDNNIIMGHSGYSIMDNVNNSVFKNNILISNIAGYNLTIGVNSNGNVFYNNLFLIDTTSIPGSDVRTLWNIAQSSIFVNQSGSTYNPHQDYHLKPTCKGKNYGTDGTDVGIYGTAAPFKQGGVPFNPHVQFQSIPTTTTGGNLQVNIKVAAQNN